MNNEKMPLKGEVGIVDGVKFYLLDLEGLPSARPNGIIYNKEGVRAFITSFDKDKVRALMLDSAKASVGDNFYLYDGAIQISPPEYLFGRIINPLGDTIDEYGAIEKKGVELRFDVVADGISERMDINEQFITGVALIDLLLPLGKGQRELIIGPPRSGKMTFARNVILNQKTSGVACIYAALGKPASQIRRFAESIFSAGARDYSIVLAARADDPAPIVSLAPNTAFALAESLSRRGRDVLLVLDDLATHAKNIREIALLSSRVPGRESYPGDIFYQHAHLMERAGSFSGRGSITLLPVLETEIESLTSLIPTNSMASTDGHLFFSSSLRAQGFFPSVDLYKSVTRVGKKTQFRAQKELADKVIAMLADYEERKSYGRFGVGVSGETRRAITYAEMVLEIIRQDMGSFVDPISQVVVTALIFTSFLSKRTAVFVRKNKKYIKETALSSELAEARAIVQKDSPLEHLFEELEKKKFVFEKSCK